MAGSPHSFLQPQFPHPTPSPGLSPEAQIGVLQLPTCLPQESPCPLTPSRCRPCLSVSPHLFLHFLPPTLSSPGWPLPSRQVPLSLGDLLSISPTQFCLCPAPPNHWTQFPCLAPAANGNTQSYWSLPPWRYPTTPRSPPRANTAFREVGVECISPHSQTLLRASLAAERLKHQLGRRNPGWPPAPPCGETQHCHQHCPREPGPPCSFLSLPAPYRPPYPAMCRSPAFSHTLPPAWHTLTARSCQ